MDRNARPYWAMFVAVFVGALPIHLQAATIDERMEPTMGCNVMVSGPIQSGDAERLGEVLRSQGIPSATASPVGTRICFDSPGGNMREGMVMASLILEHARGTAVAEGHVCESACALAFMAGSHFNLEGEFPVPDRIMHPRATVGFHAPALDIDAGAYTEAEVERAFRLALQTLALIAERRSELGYDFPESLFLTMLRTSPEDMFHVETIGQAAQLRIGVAPSGILEADPREAVINLCAAADAGLLDDATALDNVNLRPNIGTMTFDVSSPNFPSALFPFGFRAEAASGCQVIFLGGGAEAAHPTESLAVALIGALDLGMIEGRLRVPAAFTFPSDTRLQDLPLDHGGARARFIGAIVDSAR